MQLLIRAWDTCCWHQSPPLCQWTGSSLAQAIAGYFINDFSGTTVNSPHKGRWCGTLMFYLICMWIRGWVNNHEAGDFRLHHGHYDVIVMGFVHEGIIENKSALLQIMAWHWTNDMLLLSQWWLRVLTHICIPQPWWVNTLRQRQNGRHFADDIFKCIFMNENVWFLNRISLKFVRKGLIKNIPALVQIMTLRRQGDKRLSEPMMVRLPMHICVARPQWVNH